MTAERTDGAVDAFADGGFITLGTVKEPHSSRGTRVLLLYTRMKISCGDREGSL